MNRGSDRPALPTGAGQHHFNEAPIHESGKWNGGRFPRL